MINVNIKDGQNGNIASIGQNGELKVVQLAYPINLNNPPLPFSQFLTSDGTATGSNNMVVSGSLAAPIEFFIKAAEDRDLYIKSISIQISQTGLKLDKFGALPSLTNGVKFYYTSIEDGDVLVNESIKTNLDLFRDATGGKGFGDSTNAWLADIAGTGADTYFPELDITTRFGLPWGIFIGRGTSSRIVMRIQDNLTGITVFNAKAYGLSSTR